MGNTMNPQNNGYAGNTSYPQNQSYMGNAMNPQNQGYTGNNAYVSSQYYTGNTVNPKNTGYTGNTSYPQNAGVNPYRRSDAVADQTSNPTTPYSMNSYAGQMYSPYNEQEDNYNMR